MPMRKMRRYRRRRRPMMRLRRRRFSRRGSNRKEVKIYTYQTYSQTLKIHYNSTATTFLYPEQRYISNIYSGITEGTMKRQRVGSSIFVKHITLALWIRACPGEANYSVGSFYTRIMLHNTGPTRLSIGSPVSTFFRTADEINFNGIIDQSEYYVLFDKTYLITAHEGPNWTSVDYTHNGASRRLLIKIPVNRTIIYQRDSTSVKDNRDYLGFSVMTGITGINTARNDKQIGCMDATVSVYFTDP